MLSARLQCLGRGALDSRPRIGVRGKLHGNDGEVCLFWEIHRSYAKGSFRRNGLYWRGVDSRLRGSDGEGYTQTSPISRHRKRLPR